MTELVNIIDDIIPEDDPRFFNAEEEIELHETCLHMMEEFVNEHPKLITEPDFEEVFDENIHELMHSHFDYDLFYTEEAEEEMEEIIHHAKNDFYNIIMPPRSYSSSIILKQPDIANLTKQIDILRSKPQPNQRTKAWYEFRHNLITASNAYKAFENDTTQNQLIYEKCKPNTQALIDDDDNVSDDEVKKIPVQMVNTNTTLHWGQKYEPLSVKFYEYTFKTKVEDFGCIQHDTYLFLGASPDGINIDTTSPRYGRMLEIKNIVNREIDGIPKKEYWIQTQLQMEVCDLDECDFLETKFIEYPDRKAYEEDVIEGSDNMTLSKDNKTKGILIHFHKKDGAPFYLYKPLELTNQQDITKWQEDAIDLYKEHTFVQFIYWKLEKVSCVLVTRNKKWFKDNIGDLQKIWNIIEKERITGYDHRAPQRKTKKENITNYFAPTTGSGSGCLLKTNKEQTINVIKQQPESMILDIEFNDNI
jgi:putative phage-type endonuclease